MREYTINLLLYWRRSPWSAQACLRLGGMSRTGDERGGRSKETVSKLLPAPEGRKENSRGREPPEDGGAIRALKGRERAVLSPLQGSLPPFSNPGVRKKRSPPAILWRPFGAGSSLETVSLLPHSMAPGGCGEIDCVITKISGIRSGLLNAAP